MFKNKRCNCTNAAVEQHVIICKTIRTYVRTVTYVYVVAALRFAWLKLEAYLIAMIRTGRRRTIAFEHALLPDVESKSRELRTALAACGLQDRCRERWLSEDGETEEEAQVCLSTDEAAALYTRAQRIRKGGIIIAQWFNSCAYFHTALSSDNAEAHAFWFDVGGGDTEVALPGQFRCGIDSAVQKGKLKVVLWTYQRISNVPAGVEVRDAAEHVDAAYVSEVVQRDKKLVALMSDLVRLSAMFKSKAVYTVFLDGDVQWMRPISNLASSLFHGHAFATYLMPPSRQYTTKTDFVKHGMVNFARYQTDNSKVCTPFVACRGSPYIESLYHKARAKLRLDIDGQVPCCLAS
jgi:hypothetical protein